MEKILIIISMFLSVYCVNASDAASALDYKEYKEYIQSKQPSFDVLQKTLDKVMIECEKMDKSTSLEDRSKYASWAGSIINRMLSSCKLNNDQIDYCRQKLNILLNKMDLFSYNANMPLLGAMVSLSGSYLPKDISESDFSLLRKNNTELFCKEINRIEKKIDPTWHEGKYETSANVSLPRGVNGVAGMEPSVIEDPVKRKEYEKAIEENRKNAEINLVQTRIRDSKKSIYNLFINHYVTFAYKQKPYNTDELKELLNKYNIDKEAQEQILKKVEAAIPKDDK